MCGGCKQKAISSQGKAFAEDAPPATKKGGSSRLNKDVYQMPYAPVGDGSLM